MELNPFNKNEKDNSIDHLSEIIEVNNYTEDSENDFNFSHIESVPDLGSLESSLPETPNKNGRHFPVKSIFSPELFPDKKNIENYLCGLCKNVCDEAVKAKCNCGKLFCRKCLTFYYDNEQKQCPSCGRCSEGEIIQAKLENELIQSLKMKCVNCTWENECRLYKEHEQCCGEQIIHCHNKKFGCVIQIKRKNLLEHLKECEYNRTTCEKCGVDLYEKELESHKNICEKEIINCPFECGQTFIRKELEEHKKKCDFIVVKCPYSVIGCKDEFRKIDEKKRLNEDQDKHLNLLKNNIIDIRNYFCENEKRVKKLEEEIQVLKDNNNNLNNISAIININNEDSNTNDNNYNLFRSNIKEKPSESNVNNNQLLSHKRKNSSNKDEEIYSKSKEEEKRDKFNLNTPKSNKININTNINTNINVKEERGLSLEENKSIYNILDSEKRYFNIKRNVIQAICLDGKRQIFVFFDKKYDIPSLDKNQYKIRFKLLTDIKCLTMGFCDKKIVEDNMYEFNPKNSKKNKRKSDGKYYITTNKLAWNCNNCHQCKNLKFDGDENIYKKGTIFEFYFKPSECEFEVKLVGKEKPIATFRDVRCLKSKYISPFLIFLKNGEVETTFFY